VLKDNEKKYVAYCDSPKCKAGTGSNKKVMKTNLVGTPRFCPDCGSALIWTEGKLKHRVTKMTRTKDRERFV
jgi:hypothetical protein